GLHLEKEPPPPGAQTERRGVAGPVRTLPGGMNLTSRMVHGQRLTVRGQQTNATPDHFIEGDSFGGCSPGLVCPGSVIPSNPAASVRRCSSSSVGALFFSICRMAWLEPRWASTLLSSRYWVMA